MKYKNEEGGVSSGGGKQMTNKCSFCEDSKREIWEEEKISWRRRNIREGILKTFQVSYKDFNRELISDRKR